jgi:hypothetical protein
MIRVIPNTRPPWRNIADENLERTIFPGWLPVDIGEPHLVIRWVQFGPTPLLEPFFSESVEALRSRPTPPLETETELSALPKAANHLAKYPPAGVIFHMSRCGSTLVCNALKALDGLVGLSEAPSMDRMMHLLVSHSRYSGSDGIDHLAALTSVFTFYQGNDNARLVIKCSMANIVTLRSLRLLWPDVPFLILIRNPIEVVVSNCKSVPLWLHEWYWMGRDCWLGRPPEVVRAAGPAEFCAWAIGRFCCEALDNLDRRCMVMDYTDLTPANVESIAKVFGFQLDDVCRPAFLDCFRLNAKDRGRVFESDSLSKEREASETMIHSTEEWVTRAYNDLRYHSNRIRSI